MERDRDRRYVHNIPAARGLRGSLTGSERVLWEALRDRRFRGLKFRRQHAVGRFVLDFYCHELRLAIEVDGGVHNDPAQQASDRERQRLLEEPGIRFLRIPAEDVINNLEAVLDRLDRELSHSPSPAKSGEGAGG